MFEQRFADLGGDRFHHRKLVTGREFFDEFESESVDRMPVDGHGGRGIPLPRQDDAAGIERLGEGARQPDKREAH